MCRKPKAAEDSSKKAGVGSETADTADDAIPLNNIGLASPANQ
jgi:hypothetical protein